jgi:transcriptional regulator with XRE-family HTH domain
VPEKTSPEFWRWVGYFLAEGHLDEKSYLRFVNSDPAIQCDYADLTRRLFNVEVQFKRGKDAQFRSDQLREFFEALGLPVPLRAGNKRVPRLLFRCPDSEVIAFLEGYFDGDAGIARTWRRNSYHLDVYSKSKRLIRDVQHLLQRLGVIGFIRSVWHKATNTPAKKQLYHILSVTGSDLETLARRIRLRSADKQEKLNLFLEGQRHTNWDTIPIPRDLFRQVRMGLGLSQQAVAQGGSGSAISFVENGHRLPSRPMARKWLEFLVRQDREGRFRDELDQMLSLVAEDIAWDHVVAVDEIEPDTRYLYDFTMAGAPNFVGNGLFLHNTHVFTTITGACKNAFGGLLGTKRHWTHGVIHETLVDLLMIQQDIHPGLFAVMDGTFAGDGPGPRAMRWHEKDIILASADQVAIDAISAHLQGFDPLSIPFIRIAHEMGLGVGDPEQIEIVGEERDWVMSQNWHFVQEDTFASRGQKLIYHGWLHPLEPLLLRSPLVPWSYLASNFYHNVYWYPFVGRKRVEAALETKWGQLFQSYGDGEVVMPGIQPETAAIVLGGAALLTGGLLWGLWQLMRGRRRQGDNES